MATLEDVPLDAEYEGFGPVFVWCGQIGKWVGWNLAEYKSMQPEARTETEQSANSVAAWQKVADLNIEVKTLRDRITALLKLTGQPGQCKHCKRAVYWVRDRNSSPSPFNEDGSGHTVTCPAAAEARQETGSLFRTGSGGD